jgi:hypothetical protein
LSEGLGDAGAGIHLAAEEKHLG